MSVRFRRPTQTLTFATFAFVIEPLAALRPARFGGAPRRWIHHGGSQFLRESFACQLPIPKLTSGLIHGHRNDAVVVLESAQHPAPQAWLEGVGFSKVEAELCPSVRSVGVLSPWTTRRPEAPQQLASRNLMTLPDAEVISHGRRP